MTVHGGGKRRLVIASKSRKKGRRPKANAQLDNKCPTTTYLSVAALPPAVTGSPRGTGEVPRCAGGASPCAQMLMERIVLSNKVEKKAGPITKRALGVVRSDSGAGDQKDRAPTVGGRRPSGF